MNIEETTENLKKYISFSKKECNFPSIWDWNWHMDLANDVKTLLTAYKKEKETSHYIQSQLDIANAKLVEEKEKNKELKWKPIKEYDRKKYDWVLVKYFDGDYECVPEVAEKRYDGKWYTSERQIPFEVKYFFDMQQILEEE